MRYRGQEHTVRVPIPAGTVSAPEIEAEFHGLHRQKYTFDLEGDGNGPMHRKVPQAGIVRIEDDVEVGACTCIDRATLGETVIGRGTKIDNLVQVAHNVIVGKHCLLCSQVGISGSTKLEDYVVLGGQAGLGGHITIGKGAKAGGQAGITADVPAGTFVNGTPAIPFQLERRLAVLHQRLPDLFKRMDALEQQLADAKKSFS